MAFNFFKHYASKICFKFLDLFLVKIRPKLPADLSISRNLFIYFDYEREFGGHKTEIGDNDILHLLELLQKHSLKTTWFVVGRIFEKYPNSIKMILEKGHEIGSHTFSHITPLNESRDVLSRDFKDFSVHSAPFGEVYGFHAPRSRWAYKMFKYLFRYNFKYDIIGVKKGKQYSPFFLYLKPYRKILRFHIIDDDWIFFRDNIKDEKTVFDYLLSLSKYIKQGEFGGIGFHPWILFSDPNILKGFDRFIGYLRKQPDIKLDTIYNYYNKLKK
jgi:peptidoglycan/xylan/chitin deacetylase (PgdA/CDA1 family)